MGWQQSAEAIVPGETWGRAEHRATRHHGEARTGMRQPTRRPARERAVQLAFDWEEAGEARPEPSGGSPPVAAPSQPGALAPALMEGVVDAANLRRALKRVRSNKGSPGVDGMTTQELSAYLKQAWPRLKEELLAGTYQPRPVKRAEIPKPGGGVRALGIPTVVDRFIQQAIL